MMLSAASPALPTTWPTLQVDSEVKPPISAEIQSASIASVSEGGYINSDAVLTASGGWPAVLQFDSASSTIAVLLGQNSWFREEGAHAVWTNFNTYDTQGLELRAIDPVIPGSADPSTSQSSPHADARADSAQEGGLIAIQSILDQKRAIAKNGAEPSVTKLLIESPPESKTDALAAPSRMASTVRELSGEWARAAVFEIAGGEPRADLVQAPVQTGSSETVPTGILAAVKPSASAEAGAARYSADQSGVAPPNHEIALSEAASGLSLRSALAGGGTKFYSSVGIYSSDGTPFGNATATSLEAQTGAALDAAFDQIGDGEFALPSPSTDRLRLDNWLSGTPLLIMFALERLTARTSRQYKTTEAGPSASRR